VRLFAILLGISLGGLFSAADQAFRIAGYLPEYRVDGLKRKQVEGLTDLIAFSVLPRANGELDSGSWPPEKVQKAKKLASESNARFLLTVGGWGRSAGFAEMSLREKSRQSFANELLRFCKANGFAGVVYDWEFPRNAIEEASLGELLGDTRRLFAPIGLTVEIAINPSKHLRPEWTAKVDAVQIMSYDNGERHSTYEQAEFDLTIMARMRVPANKLLLGVPFYGRLMNNRNKTMTYGDIQRRYRPKEEQDEVGGFYFNGPKTMERKMKLAKDRGLGGVMIWEIGQDAEGQASLLSVLRNKNR